jgi:SpoVK/Ycf46/Vps4 family AAA+-type ATPase
VQLDGAGTNQDDRILIIGATNRPQEIDEAFLRRMSKRLYIPLPNKKSRKQLIESVIKKESEKNNKYNIQENEMEEILKITKGYSGSDLMGVCREAAMMPIRTIEDILEVSLDNIRDVILNDFKEAVNLIRPSVSEKTFNFYFEWNKNFGSFQYEEKDE